MRKILFRGKSVYSKNWLEGYLIVDAYGGVYIGGVDNGEIMSFDGFFEVIPKTVGQFTGLLTDKNGTRIFEGDIVKTDEGGWIAKVVYDNGMFYCVDNVNGFSSYCNWLEYEVIGNIHDNPELLKGDNNER